MMPTIFEIKFKVKIAFDVYDPREILSEKIRAILTRQGTKARDFLDVYLIHEEFGISLEEVFDCVIKKTSFTINLYARYCKNLEDKKSTLLSLPLNWGEEKGLLLKEIDEKDFYQFMEILRAFLKNVIAKLA